MSNEIEAIKDPGLPAHVHRKADTDPAAADRAERQVAILFGISALGTVLLIVSYIFIPDDLFIFIPIMGNQNAHQLGLGLGMAIALFFIGMGAIHWAKTLMPDTEVVAQRHEFRSPESDRKEFVAAVKSGASASGLGRRSLIKRSLGAALGLSALSPILLLRDLGPLPGKELEKTTWKSGTYLVTDPGNRRIKASDLEVGAVAQVLPEIADPEHRKLSDIAKDLLCPCHQSTFDVTRAAKVIFGPSARPLPQLDITIDQEGYLVARQPFSEPVGPSFWERNSQ